jgi:hypothetical protein
MNELNGGAGENENRRRLDQMSDVIQSMIALTLEQGKMGDQRHKESTLRHEQAMAELAEIRAQHTPFVRTLRDQHTVFTDEVRDLIELQKEQRIDIMALFAGNKQLREAWAEYLKREDQRGIRNG